MRTNNHFISVSRQGVLVARRKGSPPVEIADREVGLVIRADAAAVERGVPASLRVRFLHGGNNREVLVTTVAVEREGAPGGATGGDAQPVSAFQERFAVSDQELGRWMRGAIEALLDRASQRA